MFGKANNNHFYEVLGVSKDAPADQIKKAYRKLAMQYHPDKPTGDAEKFKEISKAYKTLSDSDSRAKYDAGGEEALGSDFFSGSDLFSNIFEMFGHSFGGGGAHKRSNRTDNVEFSLSFTLEELFTGLNKRLRINRKVLCQKCTGTGSKSGVSSTCRACKGAGQVAKVQSMGGNMFMKNVVVCDACHGTGSAVKAGDACSTCRKGQVDRKDEIMVEVQPGSEEGDVYTVPGMADEEREKETGDFVLIIKEKKHRFFSRFGNDLVLMKTITLNGALHGCKFSLKDVAGRDLELSFGKNVIKPGDVRRIAKLGMPIKGNPNHRGDLFVRFDVEFPTWSQVNKQPGSENTAAFLRNEKTVEANREIFSEENLKEYIHARQRKKKRESGFGESFFSFF